MPATSINNQTAQGSVYARNEAKPAQDIKSGAPTMGPGTMAVTKLAPAEEEATVQAITTRLRDPSYTYSNTLSDVMLSADMRKLSDQSRERVVAEMMGMINRGEIDARTFMASQK